MNIVLYFSFLFNEDCDEYKYYKKRLGELKKRSEVMPTVGKKRKKRSRWSSANETCDNATDVAAPSIATNPALGAIPVTPGISRGISPFLTCTFSMMPLGSLGGSQCSGSMFMKLRNEHVISNPACL